MILFLFWFSVLPLTTKQEPYFEAEIILNTQNIGSNFKTFKLTTDGPTTLGKFVQAWCRCLSYTPCAPAPELSVVYTLQQTTQEGLTEHTTAKPEF